jgi:hypothetical protein
VGRAPVLLVTPTPRWRERSLQESFDACDIVVIAGTAAR